MSVVHVYPLDDLFPHILDGADCPCRPKIEEVEGGIVITHNSYDRREQAEQPVKAA